MDLNLMVLCGKLAVDPEVRIFDSGTQMVRLLVTTKASYPRDRVDVTPVTYWPTSEDEVAQFLDKERGERVWACGSLQRRYWDGPDGRRSRVEMVAEQINFKEA